MSHDAEQSWVLVHSTPLLQRNGIDYHSVFVAQIHFLPSKSRSKLIISPWLSRIWKSKCIFTWRLTIRASDSHFGVTLRALQIYLIIIIIHTYIHTCIHTL